MSNLRFLLAFLVIVTLCAVNNCANAENVRSIRLYYPENLDTKGRQIPITPEVLNVFKYFERATSLKFSIEILPWKRAQLEVARGEGIIYGFSKSSERLEQFRFSLPVLSLPIWAISYGPENANIAELNDLKAKVVASGVGVTHGIEYERARNKIFTVHEDLLSHQERFKKLLIKRSDVMFIPFNQHLNRDQIDQAINDKMIKGFNDPELTGRRFNVSHNPIFLDTIHFASSKHHLQDVIDKIDLAIERGTKNGQLKKLFKAY
jgi:ABC-type amino acid transport substrate-binding protein